jgi:dCTP deaminase
MSVLSRKEIVRRMTEVRRGESEALTISPLLDPSQVDHDGVDLRLGTYFIAFQDAYMPTLDLHEGGELRPKVLRYQARIHVPMGLSVTVHPSSLVLGCTLEYIRMPADVSGEVLTRSTWGRLGLMIATAVWVHPLFAGCLTLEIANHGNVPVCLPAGISIAQLILHKVQPAEDAGKVGPPEAPDADRPPEPIKRLSRYACITRPWHAMLEREIPDLQKAKEIGKYYHG